MLSSEMIEIRKAKFEGKFNTRTWADAQGDGRPAECRWRPLFNAAKFG